MDAGDLARALAEIIRYEQRERPGAVFYGASVDIDGSQEESGRIVSAFALVRLAGGAEYTICVTPGAPQGWSS